MALRAGYKGFKKLLPGLKIIRPGAIGIDNTELSKTFFPRSEQAVLGVKNLLKNNLISGSGAGTITYTVDDDGVVTINGSHTSGVDLIVESGKNNNYVGMYISSGEDDATKAYLAYQSYEADHTTFISNTIANKNGVIIPNTPYGRVIIHINANQTLTNFKIKPMIRLATDPDSTYVPYAMTNTELMAGLAKKLSINTTIISGAGSVDLNNITEGGIYYMNGSPTNAPEGIGYFTMMHLYTSAQTQMQVIYKGGGESIYLRTKTAGNWNSWYKFAGTELS